jgi:hypothetical protein
MSGQDGEGHRFIQGRPKAGAELGIKTVTWFSPRTECRRRCVNRTYFAYQVRE